MNIEEIIKSHEELNKNKNIIGSIDKDFYFDVVDTLLARLKEYESQLELEYVDKNYIPKSVIEKKDKMIDLMLEEISNRFMDRCPFGNYDIDLDCDNRCEDNIEKECWKMYFERKVSN